MFVLFPALALLPVLIYLAAALLPAIFLLRYVYQKDALEKEPAGLLLSLLAMGCLSAFCAAGLEIVGESVLGLFLSPESPIYIILLAFLVVAAAEEGCKLFFLKLRSWNHPAFNYRFDAVVYAAFVSLGFAALENVQYVVNYGLSVALPRALLAIPGHLSFAVFMGIYYGRARQFANYGDAERSRRSLRAGYLTAFFLHGFYDACAMLGSTLSSLVFLVFVIFMFATAFRALRHEAASDMPITPFAPPLDPPFGPGAGYDL